MRNLRSILIAELSDIAAAHPQEVGRYDAKKGEIKAPTGETIKVETGRVGRSEKVYVAGKAREFLRGLDLPELRPAAKGALGAGGGTSVSLSDVPSRQACSARSWQAWFRANYNACPDVVCKAVQGGFARAEDTIRQAKEAEASAKQQEAEAETVKMLKGLKGRVGEKRLAELVKGL